MKALNFIYFHRNRIMVAGGFCGAYGYICKKATSPSVNEVVRIGVASSLAHVTIETMFHFADTVNVRAKTNDSNDSTMKMLQKIYKSEGLMGFGRGFSAMFYGSVFCGFIYFSLYKVFKVEFKKYFGDSLSFGQVVFLASWTAELFTLLVYYPYDLIKCRLQSKNYHFKYRNLPHAFRKEITEGSIFSLYRGALPFVITYCMCVSIQFTIYESVMKYFKQLYSQEGEFEKKEQQVNMFAGFLAGAVSSGLTNSFDMVTINKQTNPDLKIMEMIKTERFNLFTKGLLARVYYNSMQSLVFFHLVLHIGKIYNVDISDD